MTDGQLVTRWRPALGQRANHELTLDAGAIRRLSGVVLSLGGYIADFPRHVEISTSADGAVWDAAWQGRSYVPTIIGAIENPRTVPVRYSFLPRAARLVRVRQLAEPSDYDWSVAEVHLLSR